MRHLLLIKVIRYTRIFSWIGDRVTKTPDPQLIFDSWIYFMRRNWKLFYWKIIKLFSNMLLTAFILTSCHKNILASFFTPTPIIVLMDNVMKFKFFSSIILTNCHKNNIKPLCILSIMSIIISSLFHHSFFSKQFLKSWFSWGKKKRISLWFNACQNNCKISSIGNIRV